MAEQILQEVANYNSRESISDEGQTHHISSDSSDDDSLVSDSANTPLTPDDVNVTVEERNEDVSEESGHLMRTRTNDNDTPVVVEHTVQTVQPVSDGFTAPPPDYEEYMLTEYYISHGLECRGSQTTTNACLCSCHNELGRRNTLQNGEMLSSSYPRTTNGQSTSQHVPHSFDNGPQQMLQYGSGNYGIIQTTHVTVQSTNNANSANTDIQRNGEDKTVRNCFVAVMILIVVGGVIFAIIAAAAY